MFKWGPRCYSPAQRKGLMNDQKRLLEEILNGLGGEVAGRVDGLPFDQLLKLLEWTHSGPSSRCTRHTKRVGVGRGGTLAVEAGHMWADVRKVAGALVTMNLGEERKAIAQSPFPRSRPAIAVGRSGGTDQ